MNEANGTTSSDTLQGWKEIANHLGRSTRAAQRWERELGLPVHRIKTVDGQTVYATRSELDDWRKSRDLPKAVPEDDETTIAATELELKPAPTADSKTPPPTNVTTAPSWRFLLASCFAALAVGVLIGPYVRAPFPGPIASVQAAGTSVTAFDNNGRVVWRTEMQEQVTDVNRRGLPSSTYRAGGVNGETDADILMALRFGDPNASMQSDAVVSFNARNGKEMWRVQPSPTVVCGALTVSGPWILAGQIVISSDMSHPRIWAAFNHNTHWPSFVEEIEVVDGRTKSSQRYVQSGWIRGMAEWSSAKGHVLAVNGTMNEFSRASTALVNLDAPPATSPHGDERFGCQDTPGGAPAAVYLWPDLDVQGPEANPMATSMKVLSHGLQVLLHQGGGGTLVEIDPSHRVRSLTLPDTYWLVHRERQAAGLIKHLAEFCPEPNRSMPIETWTPATGWTHSTIVSTNRRPVQKANASPPESHQPNQSGSHGK